MPNPIPPDKVNYQKHKQRAAHHDGDRNLQAKLQIAHIRNLAYHVRPQSPNQLRRKHVVTGP